MKKEDWVKIGIVIVVILAIAFAYLQITGNSIIPVRGNCFDSDGGQNLAVKGVAEDDSVKYADACDGRIFIKEAYCNEDNRVRIAKEPCNNECKDGVCID